MQNHGAQNIPITLPQPPSRHCRVIDSRTVIPPRNRAGADTRSPTDITSLHDMDAMNEGIPTPRDKPLHTSRINQDGLLDPEGAMALRRAVPSVIGTKGLFPMMELPCELRLEVRLRFAPYTHPEMPRSYLIYSRYTITSLSSLTLSISKPLATAITPQIRRNALAALQ